MTRGSRLWRVALAALVFVHAACKRDESPKPVAPASPDNQPTTKNEIADQPQVIFEPEGSDPVFVAVEVVSTPRGIQRGLMYRQHLPPNHGMLFVFADEKPRSFWMKNTLIPLDMIFVSAGGTVVGIVKNAEPMTTRSRTVGKPSRYVVEVNAGWTDAHGVETGTRMRMENVAVVGASEMGR